VLDTWNSGGAGLYFDERVCWLDDERPSANQSEGGWNEMQDCSTARALILGHLVIGEEADESFVGLDVG
jgi:hypothetical protein